MRDYESKMKHHKKEVLQSLHMFVVSSHARRILASQFESFRQSKFYAIGTRHLFICNMHHSLFMCNTHQSEFRAIRTNLNSMQIRTRPLITCETYQSFFHEQDVPIQIPCNMHRYCIHVLHAPVFIHMQYASILYSHAIHINSLFTCNTH